MFFRFFCISFYVRLSLSCIPTRSPDDLVEITTTTETTTTTAETTTTTTETTTTETTSTSSMSTTTSSSIDNSMCQLCPNLATCGGADCPPGACEAVTSMPVRGAMGCSITYTCMTGVPFYKVMGVWMEGMGYGDLMAECGDYPMNQWTDPMGAVITATCCGG